MSSISKVVSCISGVFFAAISVACVSTAAPAQANDPASAEATTAPAPEGATVLASEHEQASAAPEHVHDHGATADSAATPEPANSSPSPAAHEHAARHEHAAPAHKEQITIYTCPMHPEIRETKPGRCPKCGMNLEPAKPDSQ